MSQGGYGAYNAYISAATRYAALGAPTLYDHPGPVYGSKFLPSRDIGLWNYIYSGFRFFPLMLN